MRSDITYSHEQDVREALPVGQRLVSVFSYGYNPDTGRLGAPVADDNVIAGHRLVREKNGHYHLEYLVEDGRGPLKAHQTIHADEIHHPGQVLSAQFNYVTDRRDMPRILDLKRAADHQAAQRWAHFFPQNGFRPSALF